MQLSEGSHPYSCLSLGKQQLVYKAPPSSSSTTTSTTSSGTGDPKQASAQPSSGGHDLSLTIPESVLTWKGDPSPGTRMLVFRVACIKNPPKPKRKPLQLINFVSRKGCRKNVAVEVNRLNLAEIGQGRGKSSRPHPQGEQDEMEQDLVGERNGWSECVNGVGMDAGISDSVMLDRGNTVPTTTTSTTTSGQGRVSHLELAPDVSGGGEGAVDAEVGKMLTGGLGDLAVLRDAAVSMVVDTPLASKERYEVGRGKQVLSKHGQFQKKSKSKLKKAPKSDAAVMTEISLGTDDIAITNTTSTTNHHASITTTRSTLSPSPSLTDHAPSHAHHAPSPPKKGLHQKGASSKLLLRNGGLNGVLNGYALPEVVATLKARRSPHLPSSAENRTAPSGGSKEGACPLLDGPRRDVDLSGSGLVKRRKKKVLMKRKLKRHKFPIGSGKRGTRSFLVSIPRAHYDAHPGQSGRGGTDTPFPSEGRGGKITTTTTTSSTYRRRSEVQLLLDRDKPRGQRLSETDTPVFTAEDISNRSSSSSSTITTTCAGSWLGSSTRKIMPVDHYGYPLPLSSLSPTRSPTKKHGSNCAETGVGEANGNCFSPTTTSHAHTPNQRKRTAINGPLEGVVFADQPPPTKQPKVATPTRVVCEEEGHASEKTVVGRGGVSEAADVVGVARREEEGACPTPDTPLPPPAPPPPVATQPPHRSAEGEGRGTPMPTPTSATFSAELVVFDSRGECLVKDGQYSILMQCCPPSGSADSQQGLGLSTFEPLTWASVFAKNTQVSLKVTLGAMQAYTWGYAKWLCPVLIELTACLYLASGC